MMPLPPVLRRISTEREERFQLRLEPTHLVFQGHFPEQPILPGLAQVDWAIRFGEQAFGPLGTFRGLSALKFKGIIRPLDELELSLTFDADKRILRFQYASASERKSSGLVLFA
jgi:3-hydroxymyristoyl/3-hydroxydecanoyl-(acyl carrier protein) dehydratase